MPNQLAETESPTEIVAGLHIARLRIQPPSLSGGTAPTNTIQGILNVARNPVNNVGALFGLASPTPPFQPTLSAAPNDWVMAVTYSGGGLSGIGAAVGSIGEGLIAIDAMGDVWIPNPSSVTELSSNGAVLSGTAGYTGGGLNAAVGLAIGYTGGGLNMPEAIALDGQGLTRCC